MDNYIQSQQGSIMNINSEDFQTTHENSPLNKKRGWTKEQIDNQHELNYQYFKQIMKDDYKKIYFLDDQNDVDKYLEYIFEKIGPFYSLDPMYSNEDLGYSVMEFLLLFKKSYQTKDGRIILNELPVSTKFLLDEAFLQVAY